MSKRITIMIDNDLDKKLREIQAKMIQNSTSAVSFSKSQCKNNGKPLIFVNINMANNKML